MSTPPKSLPPVSTQVSEGRYCHFDPEIRPGASLRLHLAGREKCRRDYRTTRAGYPCFGIEFVSSGSGRLRLDENDYDLFSGVVFCYGPSVSHDISVVPEQRMVKYFADFSGDEAARLLKEANFIPGSARQILDVAAYAQVFDLMITEGRSGAAQADSICTDFLRILIRKAGQAVVAGNCRVAQLAGNLQQWLAFIDTHFLRLHDLRQIAEELHVSSSHLCRVFHRYGRPSPFHYLTAKKMQHAAELLAVRGLPVKDVAYALGYADPYHFSRRFKQHFGCSPQHFVRASQRLSAGGDPDSTHASQKGKV